MSDHPHLRDLDLSQNSLSDLAGLRDLDGLVSLNLSGNAISRMPDVVSSFSSLTHLDLHCVLPVVLGENLSLLKVDQNAGAIISPGAGGHDVLRVELHQEQQGAGLVRIVVAAAGRV